jgi:hypothetical protein
MGPPNHHIIIMKQFFIALAALVATLNIAYGYNFKYDNLYYSIISADDRTVSVSYYSNPSSKNSDNTLSEIVIPQRVSNNGKIYTVIAIESYGFYGCTGLTSVAFPSSLTSVGWQAFSGCTSITSVTLPASLTSIEGYAFYKCTGIKSFTIPSSVTYIGSDVFYGCTGLTEVVIPNSVTSIGDDAFRGCSALTSVTILSSETSIGVNAFYGCNKLERVNISDLSAWCNISFGSYCANPLSLAEHLYLNGEEIKDLIIPTNVTKINNYAFCGCTDITLLTITSSVTSIGESAFSDCTKLSSVSIASSVTSVSEYAFFECAELKEVKITDLSAWCNISFEDCFANPLYYAHHLYLNNEEIKDLIIPENVTKINGEVFACCSELISVNIPSSVTKIGLDAFSDCTALASVTIPSSVSSIGICAFYGCLDRG